MLKLLFSGRNVLRIQKTTYRFCHRMIVIMIMLFIKKLKWAI